MELDSTVSSREEVKSEFRLYVSAESWTRNERIVSNAQERGVVESPTWLVGNAQRRMAGNVLGHGATLGVFWGSEQSFVSRHQLEREVGMFAPIEWSYYRLQGGARL